MHMQLEGSKAARVEIFGQELVSKKAPLRVQCAAASDRLRDQYLAHDVGELTRRPQGITKLSSQG
jgi:hypothetical protein